MRRSVFGVMIVVAFGGLGQMSVQADYMTTVLADNPLGYWRLGETTGPVAYDASPNDLDGAYVDGVTLGQTGALLTDSDKSALFDGETGYVNVGVRPALNQLTNDFTIEAWTMGGTDDVIVSTRQGTIGAESGYGFGFSRDIEGIFFTAHGVKGYRLVTSVPTDVWTYIAVVFDSSNDAYFYVNGQLGGMTAGSMPVIPNSQEFHIGKGAGPNHVGEYGYFDGGLDEVAIYGRSLDRGEILDHYLAAIPEPTPGDTDLDWDIDFDDFNTLANNYTGTGGSGKIWIDGDFDGDQDVDFTDFNSLANNYTGSLKTANTPEPSTLVLLSIGALAITVGWWRRKRAA